MSSLRLQVVNKHRDRLRELSKSLNLAKEVGACRPLFEFSPHTGFDSAARLLYPVTLRNESFQNIAVDVVFYQEDVRTSYQRMQTEYPEMSWACWYLPSVP